MLKTLFLTLITAGSGVTFLASSDEPVPPQPVQKAQTEAGIATKAAASDQKVAEAVDREDNGVKLSDAGQTPDELAIRLVDQAFITAYEAGDANAVAAHFTADAEYQDETGMVLRGRDMIANCLLDYFEEHPKCKLQMNVDSIRMLSPGVAIEDGHTVMTHTHDETVIECRYSTVYVKVDGTWRVASVRDSVPTDLREHSVQVRQLDWLIGDWVDESDAAIVHFACDSIDNGNFLMRTFTIQMAGQDAMNGTQRIGWDPLTGKLRTWIFDSEGSFGEGFWHRRIDEDGAEGWILKSTGVMADGQSASSTSIYKFINDHTMTWQSVDHEIGGVQQSDSEIMTIVRAAPVPVRPDADSSK